MSDIKWCGSTIPHDQHEWWDDSRGIGMGEIMLCEGHKSETYFYAEFALKDLKAQKRLFKRLHKQLVKECAHEEVLEYEDRFNIDELESRVCKNCSALEYKTSDPDFSKHPRDDYKTLVESENRTITRTTKTHPKGLVFPIREINK